MRTTITRIKALLLVVFTNWIIFGKKMVLQCR